jgi:hypothetical protein
LVKFVHVIDPKKNPKSKKKNKFDFGALKLLFNVKVNVLYKSQERKKL